ncbi:hypothetical protein EDD28_2814 [Salana multivorans]|uniref:Uncharacterized protein n=1 Tax=Salana multivorans TaxID=120377 RepID=A0A3N2D0U9_9MICO|nr:hypothetical protein EDD28_2814 [Salana multivorans]
MTTSTAIRRLVWGEPETSLVGRGTGMERRA